MIKTQYAGRVLVPCLMLCVAIISIFLPVSSVSANPGVLQVDGGTVQRSVTPGESFTHTFTVQSSPTDPELDMLVEACGFGQGLDGSYQALPAAEDTSPNSARNFITSINKTSFVLSPGADGTQTINVRFTVPQDISAGGYYAIVYVHSQPAGDGQVGVVLAVNIPVVLTVAGGATSMTGEITDVTIGEIQAGQPITVDTAFENTGNYHYKVSNRVSITDGIEELATTTVPLSSVSLVPGCIYGFQATLLVSDGLDEGTYQVTTDVCDENGTVRASRTQELVIDEEYSLFAGIDETTKSVHNIVTTGETIEIDDTQENGVRVAIRETSAGEQGRVIVARYNDEPETAARFAAPESEGGTGKRVLKYVDVYVEGLSQGTVEVTLNYTDDELGDLDETSLFLSYWNGSKWKKADNITVYTGANHITGEFTVGQLTGTIIGIGGDKGGAEAAEEASTFPVYLLWIVVVVAVVAVAVIVVLIIKMRSKVGGSTP